MTTLEPRRLFGAAQGAQFFCRCWLVDMKKILKWGLFLALMVPAAFAMKALKDDKKDAVASVAPAVAEAPKQAPQKPKTPEETAFAKFLERHAGRWQSDRNGANGPYQCDLQQTHMLYSGATSTLCSRGVCNGLSSKEDIDKLIFLEGDGYAKNVDFGTQEDVFTIIYRWVGNNQTQISDVRVDQQKLLQYVRDSKAPDPTKTLTDIQNNFLRMRGMNEYKCQ